MTRANKEHQPAHFLVAVVCSEKNTIKNNFLSEK